MKVSILIIIFTSLLSSCRQVDEIIGNRPIVDTKGLDPEVYEADLLDCYAFADEVATGKKVVTGTATGAVVGGVIGAAAGNSDTAKRGAGIGAASGTLNGTGRAIQERQRVVKNCLSGRGYLVLN
jgi:outer membrane lipoprotein SlyB